MSENTDRLRGDECCDQPGDRFCARPIPPEVPRDRAPRNYAEQRALLDDSLRNIPPGAPHDHREHVAGCFRCDLSRQEDA